MPYRTAERRIKAAWTRLILAWAYLTYRIRAWRLGIDEQWIRRAFSSVAQMDIGEWLDVPGFGFEFKAWGNEVHIRSDGTSGRFSYREGHLRCYECVIKEGLGGVVYVDEWRPETREVALEFGSKHQTHWWEIFRTGRRADSIRFVEYLKILYGEGPCSKATSSEPSTSQAIQQ